MAVGLKILFFLITTVALSNGLANPVVTVANGNVRGSEMTSIKGRPFYAFRGIPYAQPPIGDLRFQPPLAANNWSDIYDATQDGPVCIQINGANITGSENCLYIYVYTPNLPANSTQLLPVISYIHGGGFTSKGPTYEIDRPERFMDHDIVLVVLGYRLGPFGFLSTEDDVSLGNYGLLDQVMALQWVQTNIAAFGGDADKVTIFGISAGAASVSYHLLSPVSAGLFRAVITDSGSAVTPWAFQRHPRFWADQLASTLQCPTDNSTAEVNCLKQKSADDIVIALNEINGYSIMELPFVPCIENSTFGRFLTKYPLAILLEGSYNKVPIISGTNKDEGDITYSATQQYYTTIDDTFYNEILPMLLYNLTRYEHNLINVSYAVKAEYFDKIDVTNQTQVARAAIDMNSDSYFKSASDFTIRVLAKQIPVYMYSFEYAGSMSHFNFTGEKEVSHAEEFGYFFYNPLVNFTVDDQYISDQLLSMWVNFATELNPTPSGDYIWTSTPSQEQLNYLKIITNNLTMEQGFLTEQMHFWENDVPLIVIG